MAFFRSTTALIFAATITFTSQVVRAQAEPQAAASIVAAPSPAGATGATAPADAGPPTTATTNAVGADSIPDGTVITMQNWQNYRQFMPDGMAAFFEGRYFFCRPPLR